MPEFVQLKDKIVRVADIKSIEITDNIVTVDFKRALDMPINVVYGTYEQARFVFNNVTKQLCEV